MANGKKNYFRHSFFARNDIKLLRLKDEIGIGFYFYFFSLLEICGEESSEILQEKYEFHDSTIRNLWGVNLKKSERIANKMHLVGLLKFKKREKSFMFEIPNLAKYLGKYTIKKESKGPIKEKENKIKENKSDDVLFFNKTKVWNVVSSGDGYGTLNEVEKDFVKSHGGIKSMGLDSNSKFLIFSRK